eukprot:21510-Pelagococcus_subviridis.AAC.4
MARRDPHTLFLCCPPPPPWCMFFGTLFFSNSFHCALNSFVKTSHSAGFRMMMTFSRFPSTACRVQLNDPFSNVFLSMIANL